MEVKDGYLYTTDDLKVMQGWSLSRKIQVTQTRIIEWYEKNNGAVYVSFSGGKDSTVLLDLVRRVYPDVVGVFFDTGLEYPELRNFVEETEDIIFIKPEMNFKQVIETYGYPMISKMVSHQVDVARRIPDGRVAKNVFSPEKKGVYAMHKWSYLLEDEAPVISSKCCDIMKKNPAHKFNKETGLVPFIASMACESQRRKDIWLKHGCNIFDKYNPKSQPMSFWTEQDVLEYIVKYNLEYASVYGEIKQDEWDKFYTTGRARTGCMFCGYGCHLEKEPNRFQKMKQSHPKIWEYCMKPMCDGGLGMKHVLDYMGIPSE